MSAMKSVFLAIDMATQARDQVGKDLSQIERSFIAAQSQLDQLEHYAADTESRWSITAQTQTTTELMRHHYQFLERLHQAINLQQGVLSDLSIQVVESQNALLQAEFRLTGLKKVLKRQQQELDRQSSQREQKQMDELAAAQHMRSDKQHYAGGQS